MSTDTEEVSVLNDGAPEMERTRRWIRIALGVQGVLYLLATTIFVTVQLFWPNSFSSAGWFLKLMQANFAVMVVLPCYGFGLLLFVMLLDIQYRGNIEFRGLGFEFKGASAPIVLWMACMLIAILALQLLWK